MKNKKETIKKIVTFLNNPEEEGGFWLPNIQRPFVWGESQICKLFDSIMREYPISTLLIWKTNSGIRRRKFIDNWKSSLRLTDFYVPEDAKKKCLILDGQQRLQSLFIALMGSFEGRELFFDILSGELAAPDDIKYNFKFLDAKTTEFPWVKFKDLIFTSRKRHELCEAYKSASAKTLNPIEIDKINDHLEIVDRTFKMEETITYQELDSIDNPLLYTEDDVVEIFIRANAGGTKLGKSDLLFSLLSASWDFADQKMENLLESLNQHGFAFDRDFVLKTCLVVLNQGARYEVDKFRKEGVRENIENEWDALSKAITAVLDYVRGKTFVQCDRAMPTYLVLIPLIYVRYHFPDAWKTAADIDSYMLRSSLTGVFGGVPDNLLDVMTKKLNETKTFSLQDIYGVIRSQGRSLELTEDRLWTMGYGSRTIHLLFNLWYRQFNHTPAYENNMPQVDHIFPQSTLRDVKVLNPDTSRMVMKYSAAARNQLANCMLLTREENGPGGKWDTLPSEWFMTRDAAYLDMHLIPRDPALWEMNRFEDFIEARKMLILEKFKYLLVSVTPPAPSVEAAPVPPNA